MRPRVSFSTFFTVLLKGISYLYPLLSLPSLARLFCSASSPQSFPPSASVFSSGALLESRVSARVVRNRCTLQTRKLRHRKETCFPYRIKLVAHPVSPLCFLLHLNLRETHEIHELCPFISYHSYENAVNPPPPSPTRQRLPHSSLSQSSNSLQEGQDSAPCPQMGDSSVNYQMQFIKGQSIYKVFPQQKEDWVWEV